MDKKLLEAIVEMAKAAGADVKVVGINRDENKESKESTLENIPLLKFEVGIGKMMMAYLLKPIPAVMSLGNYFFK